MLSHILAICSLAVALAGLATALGMVVIWGTMHHLESIINRHVRRSIKECMRRQMGPMGKRVRRQIERERRRKGEGEE